MAYERKRATPDGPAIIVVGFSARALASSARRAGYAPLAIDVFGDVDTRKISLAVVTVEGGISNGLTAEALAGAIEAMTRAYHPVGLVYGSGFERRPEALSAFARQIRVFGNNARTVARVKDPVAFARACADCRVRHPPIALRPPDEPEGWLMKHRGAAGGAHIHAATRNGEVPPGAYFQRAVRGHTVSAFFVADGEAASIIGLSAQWTAPTRGSPFRYGGAVGPVGVGPAQAVEIERAVRGLTRELGLVGINSADFIVSGDIAWLLEINPRPGASLDVFDRDGDALFGRHLAACDGRITNAVASSRRNAAQLVYASSDTILPLGSDWPDWTADRPAQGTHLCAGDPLCTVMASASSVTAARRLVGERARQIGALVKEWAA